jgi:hypothetical protein
MFIATGNRARLTAKGTKAMDRNLRNPVRVAALALATLTFLIFTASARLYADEIVGSVINANGIVQITRAGATIEAVPGTPVRLHDTVATQPGASATLGFPDGSSLALGESTTVAIQDSQVVGGQAMPSRVTLLGGRVHTNVNDKSAGASHTIEVDTPHIKAVGH